jgi:hypothetical protein
MIWKIIAAIAVAGFAGRLWVQGPILLVKTIEEVVSRKCNLIIASFLQYRQRYIYYSKRLSFLYKDAKENLTRPLEMRMTLFIRQKLTRDLIASLDRMQRGLLRLLKLPRSTRTRLMLWYEDFIHLLKEGHLSIPELRRKLKQLRDVKTPERFIEILGQWEKDLRFKDIPCAKDRRRSW